MSKDRPAWADAGRRSDDKFPPRPHIPDSMMDQRFRNMRCRRTRRCQSARRKAELGDVRCGRECGAFFLSFFIPCFLALESASQAKELSQQSSPSPVEDKRQQRSRRSHSLTRSPHGPHTLSLGAVTHSLSFLCTVSETRWRNWRAFDTLSYFSSD